MTLDCQGGGITRGRYKMTTVGKVIAYSMEAESKAMQRTLHLDPKGIELILGLISKAVPQAASARAEDFYDPRFFTELKESGFLKRLWGES